LRGKIIKRGKMLKKKEDRGKVKAKIEVKLAK
jgi:hypothetical protein